MSRFQYLLQCSRNL